MILHFIITIDIAISIALNFNTRVSILGTIISRGWYSTIDSRYLAIDGHLDASTWNVDYRYPDTIDIDIFARARRQASRPRLRVHSVIT